MDEPLGCKEQAFGQRLQRLRALAQLGEMADRGDFDEFLGNKAAYRPVSSAP
jgi:hypothetical protein